MVLNNYLKFLKINSIKILFFILFLNVLLKIITSGFSEYDFLVINLEKIFSLILTCFFYWNLSSILNKSLNIASRSISLIFFFSSYFLLDNVLILFSKNISSTFVFILTTTAWLSFFLIKVRDSKIFVSFVFSLFFMKMYNFFAYKTLSKNINYSDLNGDFMFQWYPTAKKIYELGYYHAITNNIIENQGLLSSYIQALLNRINFTTEYFEFIQINSFILCFFTLLIFVDMKINIHNRFYIIGIFLLFVLNNEWVFYLFFNSLMIEGVVVFFLSACLINLKEFSEGKNIVNIYYFICFGLLVLTKQFVSIIAVITVLYLIFSNIKKNKFILLTLFPLLIDYIIKKMYNLNTSFVTYDDNLNYLQTFYDLVLFQNLNIQNIYSILNGLTKDKPLVIILALFLIFNFLSLFMHKDFSIKANYIFYICLLNFLFVIILYTTYWKNVETASSYRYLISFFNLYLISIVLNTEDNNYYAIK